MKRFNDKLREVRRGRGYTQKDMYKKLDVSANCYASWEQGRTEPNIGNIQKLCELLDISADSLLCIEINEVPNTAADTQENADD